MLTPFHLALLAAVGTMPRRDDPPRTDTLEVERVAAMYAVQHLLNEVPRGPTAFDSLPANGLTRSHAQSVALAKILAAKITNASSVISCTAGPGSCRMNGFSALVGVHLESVSDSVAEVAVRVQQPSGFARVPVSTYEPTLLVEKHRGEWRVVRIARARST